MRRHVDLIRFDHKLPDFRVEGGETFAQVQARLKGTVLRLAAARPGQTIALFSHGTAIRCLQAALRGLGPGEMDGLGHSDDPAVTCLEVEGERTRTVFENDNSHLPDASPPWPASGGGRGGMEQAAMQTCGSGPST